MSDMTAIDKKCRARDMAFGRCDLPRRHEGPHEMTDSKKRVRWDANGTDLVYHPVDHIRLTFTVK